jgi:hypothetical protein
MNTKGTNHKREKEGEKAIRHFSFINLDSSSFVFLRVHSWLNISLASIPLQYHHVIPLIVKEGKSNARAAQGKAVSSCCR